MSSFFVVGVRAEKKRRFNRCGMFSRKVDDPQIAGLSIESAEAGDRDV